MTTSAISRRRILQAAAALPGEELQQKGVAITKCDRSLFETRCRPLWDDYVAKNPKAKPLLDGIVQYRA